MVSYVSTSRGYYNFSDREGTIWIMGEKMQHYVMHSIMAAVVDARRCTTPWRVVGEGIKFILIDKGAGD